MEKTAYFPAMAVKVEDLLVKWEKVITVIVTLFPIAAIVLGIAWLFLKKEILLFLVLGFSSCYFLGRNAWKFREKKTTFEDEFEYNQEGFTMIVQNEV
jgi:hypothetical protein